MYFKDGHHARKIKTLEYPLAANVFEALQSNFVALNLHYVPFTFVYKNYYYSITTTLWSTFFLAEVYRCII